jgi:hypothetical protein
VGDRSFAVKAAVQAGSVETVSVTIKFPGFREADVEIALQDPQDGKLRGTTLRLERTSACGCLDIAFSGMARPSDVVGMGQALLSVELEPQNAQNAVTLRRELFEVFGKHLLLRDVPAGSYVVRVKWAQGVSPNPVAFAETVEIPGVGPDVVMPVSIPNVGSVEFESSQGGEPYVDALRVDVQDAGGRLLAQVQFACPPYRLEGLPFGRYSFACYGNTLAGGTYADLQSWPFAIAVSSLDPISHIVELVKK